LGALLDDCVAERALAKGTPTPPFHVFMRLI
jgi:hypothetical protein